MVLKTMQAGLKLNWCDYSYIPVCGLTQEAPLHLRHVKIEKVSTFSAGKLTIFEKKKKKHILTLQFLHNSYELNQK